MRPTDSDPMLPSTLSTGRPALSPVGRGFLVGITFGLLALFVDIPSALLVFAAGLVGALVGLGVGMLQAAQLDFREALAALLKRRGIE